MSRLTKEEILNFPKTTYGRALGKTIASKVMNELLQYKDLEEQIGCPLEVITQALKQVIWYLGNRERNYLYQMSANALKFIGGEWVITNGFHYANTQDYKKTWWLKEDKSE